MTAWVPLESFKPRDGQSYVYLLNCGDARKIGRSKKPKFRAASLERTSGREILSAWVLEGSYDSSAVERHLHVLFSGSRMSGEWFTVSSEDVRQISICTSSFPPRIKKAMDPDAVMEMLHLLTPQAAPALDAESVIEVLAQFAVFGSIVRGGGQSLSEFSVEFADLVKKTDAKAWASEFEQMKPQVREFLAIVFPNAGLSAIGGAA